MLRTWAVRLSLSLSGLSAASFIVLLMVSQDDIQPKSGFRTGRMEKALACVGLSVARTAPLTEL